MKKIAILMLTAACFAACQKNELPTAAADSPVKIDPIITRATEVNFEDGDRIGLTITKSDNGIHAENQLLTYGNGVFSSSLIWYKDTETTSQLTAYYPYSESGAPTSFTVAADQTGAGFAASDLMGASKPDVHPSANAISMTFKHLLSKIVLNLTNKSGADITSVTLKGSIPTANVDLTALTVEADSNAAWGDIKAQQVTANTTYRAIVIPQTVAFVLAVTTSEGETLTQKLASATLVSKGQYSVDVTVLPDGLVTTISGEIENWTDEGSISVDENVEVAFEEFDTYFMYDGVRYETVTLANGQKWMAEPMRYIPTGYQPSADPLQDSHIWYPYELINDGGITGVNASGAAALTDEVSIEKLGYLYDAYVAFGGKEITVDNCYGFEGVQGICPEGWHVPTRLDWVGLCGYSNKNALGETSALVDNTALFYNSGYNGGKISAFDDAGWNFVRSGVRQQNNFAATPAYQLTQIWSGNSSESLADAYGTSAMSYYLSSTCYQPNYSTSNPDEHTNTQFFAAMTTFTKTYPEGKVSVAYMSIKAGSQIRCVKND